MNETKITVKIIPVLLDQFSAQLAACFIKRDAFIEHLILKEIPHLSKEMAGKRLTPEARRYISGELKRQGPLPVNIKVKQDTADQLNAVVKESNMVRDAFINRLIFLLTASEERLRKHCFPKTISEALKPTGYVNADLPASPLSAIEEIIDDPLWYLREWDQHTDKDGIYLWNFNGELPFMACYMENQYVPGTPEYGNEDSPLDDFLVSL